MSIFYDVIAVLGAAFFGWIIGSGWASEVKQENKVNCTLLIMFIFVSWAINSRFGSTANSIANLMAFEVVVLRALPRLRLEPSWDLRVTWQRTIQTAQSHTAALVLLIFGIYNIIASIRTLAA